MLGSIWYAVKASVGFSYLYLRYWRPRRVREQLLLCYDNRYATAGSAVMRGLIQGMGVVLLLILGAALLLVLGRAILTVIWR